MSTFRLGTITAVLLGVFGVLALAQKNAEKAADSKPDKAEIESIVRAYILEHPEVLLESVRGYEERQRRSAVEQGRKAMVAHEEELLRDKATPWAGASSPEATVVQFFDYRCGYCKRVLPTISKVAKEPGVRVVYKELPILGPESVQSARLALAAQKQGKYFEVHEALMSGTGSIKPETVQQIASQHGLDAEKLKKDMESAEVSQTLSRNQALAMALGVNSTPTFVIGSELVPGAIDAAQLNAMIERSRKKGAQAQP